MTGGGVPEGARRAAGAARGESGRQGQGPGNAAHRGAQGVWGHGRMAQALAQSRQWCTIPPVNRPAQPRRRLAKRTVPAARPRRKRAGEPYRKDAP